MRRQPCREFAALRQNRAVNSVTHKIASQHQQHPLQQGVEDMVQAASELLGLRGPASEGTVNWIQRILAVTSDTETAFEAAASALNASVAVAVSLDDRIGILEKKQARAKALAVFRHPIEVFQDAVAEETGRTSWQKLAKALYFEHHRQQQPVRAEVKIVLGRMGFSV